MKKSTKLRLFGAFVILFNIWAIGEYNITGAPALLMTFGFAIVFELLVVKPLAKKEIDV